MHTSTYSHSKHIDTPTLHSHSHIAKYSKIRTPSQQRRRIGNSYLCVCVCVCVCERESERQSVWARDRVWRIGNSYFPLTLAHHHSKFFIIYVWFSSHAHIAIHPPTHLLTSDKKNEQHSHSAQTHTMSSLILDDKEVMIRKWCVHIGNHAATHPPTTDKEEWATLTLHSHFTHTHTMSLQILDV